MNAIRPGTAGPTRTREGLRSPAESGISIEMTARHRRRSVLLGLLVLAACTHLSPYYREAQPRQVGPPTDEEVDHRLLLIGDAGDPRPSGEPVLQVLKTHARLMPERTTVVFLGDNVYERGMPPRDKDTPEVVQEVEQVAAEADALVPDFFDNRKEAERIMNAQIDVVRGSTVNAIFIPGNHDWDQFELGGWDRILEQEKFIKEAARDGTKVQMLPSGGCPGPVPLPLGARGEIILLDTQWWLETREDGKPTPQNNPTGCSFTGEKEVRQALVSQIQVAAKENRRTIVVGHHPLASEGPHGGYVDFRTHLFPFLIIEHYVPVYVQYIPVPLIGTAVVLARKYASPSPQDLVNRRNKHMRAALQIAMAEAAKSNAPVLAYVAGHDHSLQIFDHVRGPKYALVSGLGNGGRSSSVSDAGNTLFAHSNPLHPGFMQVDFLANGEVRLGVIEVDHSDDSAEGRYGEEVYSLMLTDPVSTGTAGGASPVAR